jgi:hypothetical protein
MLLLATVAEKKKEAGTKFDSADFLQEPASLSEKGDKKRNHRLQKERKVKTQLVMQLNQPQNGLELLQKGQLSQQKNQPQTTVF